MPTSNPRMRRRGRACACVLVLVSKSGASKAETKVRSKVACKQARPWQRWRRQTSIVDTRPSRVGCRRISSRTQQVSSWLLSSLAHTTKPDTLLPASSSASLSLLHPSSHAMRYARACLHACAKTLRKHQTQHQHASTMATLATWQRMSCARLM